MALVPATPLHTMVVICRTNPGGGGRMFKGEPSVSPDAGALSDCHHNGGHRGRGVRAAGASDTKTNGFLIKYTRSST